MSGTNSDPTRDALNAMARAGRIPYPIVTAETAAPIQRAADLAPLPPARPHLPPPMRILSPEETRAVHDGVRAAARRHGVSGEAADEIGFDALAAAGLFLPPPAPAPYTCTALYLPHEIGAFEPEMLGQWQQCEDEPGHDGNEHTSGDTEWGDDYPGAVPARELAGE